MTSEHYKWACQFRDGDYYPFGMLMRERSNFNEGYRFGFNGQEQDDDISGSGNSTTAEFWQYDSRLGRRWNIDPLPVVSCSPYSCLRNNPIFFIDPLGDTTFVNSSGDITDQEFKKDGSLLDELVYYVGDDGDERKLIGEFRGNIDMDQFWENNLGNSSEEALDPDFSKVDWVMAVKKGGNWDLKNNKGTIWGAAWAYDHSSEGKKNEQKTQFQLEGEVFGNAADVGNFHAGYTGTYAGVPMLLQSIGAGGVEVLKNVKEGRWNELKKNWFASRWLPTWGDSPRDWAYNRKGMKQAAQEMDEGEIVKTYNVPEPPSVKNPFYGPKF